MTGWLYDIKVWPSCSKTALTICRTVPAKSSAASRRRGGRNRTIFSWLAAVAAANILSTTDWVIFSCPWQRHARRIALNNTGCCSSSRFMPKLSSLTTWTTDGWPGRDGKRKAQNRLPGSPIFVRNCFPLFPWSPKQKNHNWWPRCWKCRDSSLLDTLEYKTIIDTLTLTETYVYVLHDCFEVNKGKNQISKAPSNHLSNYHNLLTHK